MQAQLAAIQRADAGSVATLIAVVGALGIVGFLFFQYVVGLAPCPLCLEQRYAFYFAVPLAVLLWLGADHGASHRVLAAGFAAIAIAMLWNTGLAVYHSGIEWKLWAAPGECTGSVGEIGGRGGLLNQLQSVSVVRCDEAAWRFLGLSLAGWNIPLSLGLALAALWGARGAYVRGKQSAPE
jgi:disulfide bond formation protein DsbB